MEFILRQIFLIIALSLFSSFIVQAKPNGAQLYSTHCAACHGADGHGGVGVPLALPDFQYGVTNRYLTNTIRAGRPGRIMPAFDYLTSNEINEIVKHIRSWAPGKAFKYSDKKIEGNIQHGKDIFKSKCISCHGVNGQGGKGTGVTFSRPRDLPVIAPALNNEGFLSSASDTMIKTVLMNGREGTPMLSFLKQGLNEEDINDVVAYVRSFEKQPHNKKKNDKIEPTISYDSPYSLNETIDIVTRSIVGKNFKIIREQYLNQGLVQENSENKDQVMIYFCNFNFLNKALVIDPRVGLFLPCRITIIKTQGKVKVMATNPLAMSRLFNNEELHKLCQEMYDLYTEILEEATF